MAAKDNPQLDRIEAAILGNGHEGLIARTARIEEKLETTAEDVIEAKDAAANAANKAKEAFEKTTEITTKLMTSIIQLEESVKTHHASEHLSTLVKKKQFWTVIIVGYIVLHILATYVPNVWDWLVVLVGVPRLSLPIK